MVEFRRSPLFWPVVLLALLLAWNAWNVPGFFSVEWKDGHFYGSVIDILARSAPLVLAAMGMSFVISTGGIDLSVGSVAALTAAGAAVLLQGGHSLPLSLALGLLLGIAAGAWNGWLVTRVGLQPIIATLTTMIAGRGVAQLLVDGQILPVENANYGFLGRGYFLGMPFSVTLALVLLSLALLARRVTALGLFLEAIGSSASAARHVGLPVNRLITAAYVLSGFFAGAAGILASANIQAVDVNNLGLYLELDAILAAVIGGSRLQGGRFSLVGAALGAWIIQTVTTTIDTQGVSVQFMLVVKALVILLLCLFQSPRFRAALSLKSPGGVA